MEYFKITAKLIFLIELLPLLHYATCDGVFLISVKSASSVPQIKKIPADLDAWTNIVDSNKTFHLGGVDGQRGNIMFGKLGVYYQKSIVFYSDRLQKDIDFLNFTDFSGRQRIRTKFPFTSSQIGGIAVDWISKNVYWTDQVYNWILMTPIDGKFNNFMTIVDTELDIPGNVKVYPLNSYLFWADYGKQPKIERSDLLGNHRTTIVDDVVTPVALEIDYPRQDIYWVDVARNAIVRSDFNGQNKHTLIQRNFVPDLVGISIFQDHMLGVSSSNNNIYLMSLSNGSVYERHLMHVNQSFDITMFAEELQPPNKSPCVNSCAICVGRDNNSVAECACPVGKHLISDTECSEFEDLTPPVYIFMQGGHLCAYSVWRPDIAKKRDPTCFMGLTGGVLAHDVKENHIFIGGNDSITKIHWSTKNASVIIDDTSAIRAISVNWVTHSMYWTNAEGSIMSATTNGARKRTVVKDLPGLVGIAVHPFHGFIYWTCQGVSPYIGRANEDGSNIFSFVRDLQQPSHLVFDFAENRLYWADNRMKTIESVNMKGSERRTMPIQSSVHFIKGIAVYQDYVIWVDRSEAGSGIGWSFKNGKVDSQGSFNLSDVGSTIILYGEYSQPNPKQKPTEGCICGNVTVTKSGEEVSTYTSTQHATSMPAKWNSVCLTIIGALIIVILVIVIIAGFCCYKWRHRSHQRRSIYDNTVPVQLNSDVENDVAETMHLTAEESNETETANENF